MKSTVYLFRDIGFDRNHRFVRDFETEDMRNEWFADRVYMTVDANYDRVQDVLKLEMDLNDARTCSYAIVEPYTERDGIKYPDDREYCFVSDVYLINDRTVGIRLTRDYWQMYAGIRGNLEITKAFVERKHMPRWYRLKNTERDEVLPLTNLYPTDPVTGFMVVERVQELATDTDDFGVSVGMMVMSVVKDERIVYYGIPVLDNRMTPLLSGGDPFYSWVEFTDGTFLTDLSIDPNAVTSITIIPYGGVDMGIRARESDDEPMDIEAAVGKPWVGAQNRDRWYFVADTRTVTTAASFVKRFALDVDYPEFKETGGQWWENEPMRFASPCVRREVYFGGGGLATSIPDTVALFTHGWDVVMIPMLSAGGCSTKCAIIPRDSEYDVNMFPGYSSLGLTFDIPGIPVDTTSDNWLTYALTQQDTDRKLIATNSVSGIVDSVSRGLIGGNLLGALGGVISGLIGTGTSYVAQGIQEEGIRNRTNSVATVGVGQGALYMGALFPSLVTSKLNRDEFLTYQQRLKTDGYIVERYMSRVPYRVMTKYDFIKTSDCTVRCDATEDMRVMLANVFNMGVTVMHDNAEIGELVNIEVGISESYYEYDFSGVPQSGFVVGGL